MLLYCLKCRKNTKSIMLLSKCAMCDSKKSKFIKEKKASGILSSLGLKTPFSKIPLVGSPL